LRRCPSGVCVSLGECVDTRVCVHWQRVVQGFPSPPPALGPKGSDSSTPGHPRGHEGPALYHHAAGARPRTRRQACLFSGGQHWTGPQRRRSQPKQPFRAQHPSPPPRACPSPPFECGNEAADAQAAFHGRVARIASPVADTPNSTHPFCTATRRSSTAQSQAGSEHFPQVAHAQANATWGCCVRGGPKDGFGRLWAQTCVRAVLLPCALAHERGGFRLRNSSRH